jgi:hypothetical protein
MPTVGKKKFPYTPSGLKAAAEERAKKKNKSKKKTKPKKRYA